jgi:hypothetical protein
MYFSQLISKLGKIVIQVVTAEDGGKNAYAGELFDLPFSLFRRWHDYKVLEIAPMYAMDEEKPFLRIEIEYAERGKK